jgi:ribosome-associated protein
MEQRFDKELTFTTSRSSGPGGQHVNKVNTKVELRFDINNSALLGDEEKAILIDKLKNKINKDRVLIIISQHSRSQIKNKEKAIEQFYRLVEKALTPTKKRIATKTPARVHRKRLENKLKRSEIKELRKPPKL